MRFVEKGEELAVSSDSDQQCSLLRDANNSANLSCLRLKPKSAYPMNCTIEHFMFHPYLHLKPGGFATFLRGSNSIDEPSVIRWRVLMVFQELSMGMSSHL